MNKFKQYHPELRKTGLEYAVYFDLWLDEESKKYYQSPSLIIAGFIFDEMNCLKKNICL